jgi:alkylation response protein AidB-like acyl-CoA dehydrogenase
MAEQQNTEHLDAPEEAAFRLKARAYLAGRLPPRRADEPVLDWDDPELVARDRRIQRDLFDGGLAGLSIPEAYGGQGLGPRHEQIFLEEAQPYRLPWHFGVAFNVVIPTILAQGSEALKTRHVPAILRGEAIWCQLLSEPSGGSDLAGLLTRATRKGDQWLLNGSKVWTTGGNMSDFGLCLARTDPDAPKHAGLTMFVVPLKSPGMSITPIKLIDGSGDFCQEFMDDVAVGDEAVVGKVNDGWRVATVLMVSERAAVGRGWHIGYGRAATAEHLEPSRWLLDLARGTGRTQDPHARQLVGEAIVLDAMQTLTIRRVASAMRVGAMSGYAAALPKLMIGKLGARRTALVSELAGPQGVAVPKGGAGPALGLSRVMSHNIGGGTGEMQANAVAERLLSLPRDPGFDREQPFSKLLSNAPPPRPSA